MGCIGFIIIGLRIVLFRRRSQGDSETVSELREADPRSLGEFVAVGCVLEDRTLFRNVGVLPTASAWVFRNGGLDQKAKYFDPAEWESQGPLAAEDYYLQLREVFSRNLPRYFDGSGE